MADDTIASDGSQGGAEILVERYQIERRLGAGGMAVTFLAADLNLHNRLVVVKIPHADLLLQPGFRERFVREVKALAQSAHPHIVRILDADEHEGEPFAVVEYQAGGALSDRIVAAKPPEPELVAEWLRGIAGALDYIHGKGLIHRDVKPDNILFDERGHISLSDFGIAKALQDPDSPDRPKSLTLTDAGVFIGSPNYAPPEAITREVSPAYDQYSLGVVAYEVLARRLPFETTRAESMVVIKAHKDPEPLVKFAPHVPAGTRNAVMRALSRDPAQRFPSCREFADAFETGLRQGGWRPPAWLMAAAAALVIALVFGKDIWRSGKDIWLRINPNGGIVLAETKQSGEDVDPTEPIVFRMGSTPDEIAAALDLCARYGGSCEPSDYADEAERTVSVLPVELEPSEATNQEFARFAAESGHQTTAEQRGHSYIAGFTGDAAKLPGRNWRAPEGPGSSIDARPSHPVVHVSAADAEAYCSAQGERLPTEAEWELAARSLDRRIFPWGEAWQDNRANWSPAGDGGPKPVGSFTPGDTPKGQHDLAGNVWEWTATSVPDGRLLKGGSWKEGNPANLRAAARLSLPADYTSADVGFRCVRGPDSTPAGS